MPARLAFQGGLAVVAVLALSGCGEESEDGLDALAPPDAPLYAEISVRPDDDEAETITRLAQEIGGLDDPGAAIVEELDSLFAENELDLTYEEDVADWLGESAALFVRSFESGEHGVPELAALFEVDDREAAEATLGRLAGSDPAVEEERTYGDFEYLYGAEDGGFAAGIVEDALVLGTEASFKLAVDAVEGESLAESEEYQDRVAELDEDPLALVFFDPGTVIEAAIASEDISNQDAEMIRPFLAEQLAAPAAVGLTLVDDSASLDIVTAVDDSEALEIDPELLEDLPGGSWLALGISDVGSLAERSIDRLESSGLPGAGSLEATIRRRTGLDVREIAEWLGDASAFVGGTSALTLSAGVIAETADPDGPVAVLERLRQVVERRLPNVPVGPPPEGASDGFSIGLPGGLPGAGEAAVTDGTVVATFGTTVAEVLDPAQALGDEERFGEATEALDGDLAPFLYLDLPSLLTVAELGGAAEDPGYVAAAPFLDLLGYAIAGTRLDDGLAVTRLTVGFEEESG